MKKQKVKTKQKLTKESPGRIVFPKTLNILGCKYAVKLVKKLNAAGTHDSIKREIKIKIRPMSNGREIESWENTFYHEVVHCLLNCANGYKLSSNEQIVVPLALALRDYTNQMIKLNRRKK